MTWESQRRPSMKMALAALILLSLAWTAVTRSEEGESKGETKPKDSSLSAGALARLGKVADARAVEAIAYAPDGKTLVSAHRDHSLCVWDAVSFKLLRSFRGPEREVTSIVFAPDGKDIMTVSKDDCAAVWELAEGRKALALQVVGQRLLHAAYAADGQPLAWLVDNTHVIRQHNVASGAEMLQFRGHSERVLAAALAPDGVTLASSSADKSVILWDLATGKETSRLKPGQDFGGRRLRPVFEEPITSLRFAPNGWTLFGGTAEQVYFVWDMENHELLAFHNTSAPDCFRAMAFSPDGQLLLYPVDGTQAEGDDERRGWREGTTVASFEVLGTIIYRDQEKVTSLAFSPDGRHLAAGIADGTVMVWDPVPRLSSRRSVSPYTNVAWNSVQSAAVQERLDFLWAELGSPLARKHFEARWSFVDIGPPGVEYLKKKLPPAHTMASEGVRKLIAELDADDPEVRAKAYAGLASLGSTIDAELRKAITGRPAPEIKQKAEMLLETIDPQRTRRAVLVLEQMHSKESRAVLQDLAKGEPAAAQTQEAQAALKRLARRAEPAPPSSTGPNVAPIAEAKIEVPAKAIKLLERLAPLSAPEPGLDVAGDPLPPGALARMGSVRMRHRGGASAVLFSQDGKNLLSAGGDEVARFWDPATGKELRHFPLPGGAAVMSLSADGKTLLTEGRDMQIACWDLATGQEKGRFSPDIKSVMPFRVSPDLRLVICNGIVWEPATGKPWRLQPKAASDRAMAFGADGKTVIFDSERGLCLYDLATGAEIRRLTGAGRRFVNCSQDGKLLVTKKNESFQVVEIATGKIVREIAGHESIRQFMKAAPIEGANDYGAGTEWVVEEYVERHGRSTSRYPVWSVMSADARTLAISQGNGVYLLDLVEGDCCKLDLDQQDYFSSMAFAPDGKLLAAALSNGRVGLWNTATGKPQLASARFQGMGGASSAQRISADGKTLAGMEPDGRVGLWDVDSGCLRARLGLANQMVFGAIWMRQGTKMITLNADYETCLWDTADGQLLWRSRRGDQLIGFANDGKVFASIYGEDSVKLYDMETGKALRRLSVPGMPIVSAALRPDGKEAASTGGDWKVRVWDVASGNVTHVIEPHQGHVISSLAYAPDGKLLATAGSDGFISLWDGASKKRVRRFAAAVESTGFLVFSPDGKLLTARDDGGCCSIWDSVTGKLLHRIDAHGDEVVFAGFTPDGRRIITAGNDGTALVWDLAKLPAASDNAPAPARNPTKEAKGVLARMGQPGAGSNVWLAHDGRTMISRDANEVYRLLDVVSGKELRRFTNLINRSGRERSYGGYGSHMSRYDYLRLRALEEEMLNLNFNGRYYGMGYGGAYNETLLQTDRVDLSPDGKLLVAWGWSSNSVAFWDAVSGEKINQFVAHPGVTSSLVFSPDGKLVATSGAAVDGVTRDNTIRIWEAPSGRLKQTLVGDKAKGAQLTFSPDGRYLLASATSNPQQGGPNQQASIMMWDLKTGKLVRNTRIPAIWIQFSPDGRTIAYHTGDNLFLWDMVADRFLPRPQVKRGHSTCVFSRDGKIIATAGEEDPIRWWDVATGAELGSIDELGAYFVGFSHDAKILVTTKGSAVRTWDLATRKELRPAAGHREAVTALAFAPDKRTLISGSGDATVRVWDVKTNKEIRCLTGHKEWINHVAYAPHGRWFASSDQGNTVIVWDAATGKEKRRFPGPVKANPTKLDFNGMMAAELAQFEGIAGLVAGADGKSLIGVNRMAGVWKWDVETGKKTTLIAGSPDAASGRGGQTFSLAPNGRWLGTSEMAQYQVSEEVVMIVGIIRVWDVTTGKLARTIMGSQERFANLAFSPDGKLVMASAMSVTGGRHYYNYRETGVLRVWEVETGQEVRSRTGQGNASFGFSFDGDALIGTQDGGVSLTFWDLAAGQDRVRVTGLERGAAVLAWAGDGSCLAVAGDREIVVLDARAPALHRHAWPALATPRSLDDLWLDLAGDPASAFEAMHLLTADPAKAIPFLAKHLRPAVVPQEERLQKLLLDLDHNIYAIRQAAERELEMFEEEAGPPLRQYLQKKSLSPDARGRAERLLARLDSGPSTEQLRHLRGLTVLMRIGSREARAIVQTLADGAASSRLTREAKMCLERFGPQP